ncbi:trehalose operon repressor [Alicyclobacillus fastidiosus]|uniref:Trehalose operon repressor n=1 Tax=Alicyclobacillus fastidiosus TaxID=392011 RepID=A0ABY6ZJL0_9BACL|nr:trehalose operon repressor [Alicyclobacillus fastidiosus]WAH42095.1 trehalose operon repressor [Alicyclobacillus fastidiosus]GMA63862.1 trehalose operon repressor [Alicyclobacillus fastidiosus]
MKTKAQAIYDALAANIQNGTYKPNSKLPSEYDLIEQYGVSRGTIRQALEMLSQDGYIQRLKGKGSIVLDIRKYNFPVTGLVSFKEVSKMMHGDVRTIVNELTVVQPDDFIQSQLDVGPTDDVWRVVRTREIQGEKIILDIDYFDRKYVPFLTKEICTDSIYEYLENELHLSISFAKKEIVVESATDEDKAALDLGDFPYVVIVKNHVYLEDASLFEYTESRHRPDKFQFVDFARRNHLNKK